MDARISLHEKCPKYGVFSGPYFPVFGLKAEISETSSTEVLAKTALHRFFNKKTVLQSLKNSKENICGESDFEVSFTKRNLKILKSCII